MGSSDESATSVTLLSVLCQPEKNEEAWRLFYERYQPLIHRWCARFRLQAADLDDVCQQVLKRVFTSVGTYDAQRGDRFRGWLKTVVENVVRDLARTAGRRPGDRGSGDSDVVQALQEIAEPETISNLADELDGSLQRDMAEIVGRVKQDVAPDTWRCFEAVVLEGKTIDETAVQMGKSYAAVCMAIQRVKKKLRAEGARLGA
jgi:RNA polymerase sigma-70 factor (ECF subfamily)